MDSLYGDAHRAFRTISGRPKLADCSTSITSIAPSMIRTAPSSKRGTCSFSRPWTRGNPTVSYKGGPTGVVTVLGDKELAFPGYDGNGMFLSMGNITGQGKVGMLFIDFETPHRLRVQGTALILRDDPLKDSYPRRSTSCVAVESVWVNCPRYIHRYTKVEQSRYVPKDGAETPFASGSGSISSSRSSRTRIGLGWPRRANSISGLWRTRRTREGLRSNVIANGVKQSRAEGRVRTWRIPGLLRALATRRCQGLRATMKTRGKARSRCPSAAGGRMHRSPPRRREEARSLSLVQRVDEGA